MSRFALWKRLIRKTENTLQREWISLPWMATVEGVL
jgi:hypothetical protein